MFSNEQTVKEVLEEISAQKIYEQQQVSLNEIQAVANKFLEEYNEAYRKWQSLSSRINNTQSLRNKINQTYLYMRQDENITRKMLEMVHTFETDLNNLFHRTIYLTYVDKQTGQLMFYDEIQTGKIYQQATKNRGRGNISQSKIIEMEQSQLEDKLKKALKQSIENKKGVYQQALSRYDKNASENHMNYDPSKNTFWWRQQNNWPKINHTDPFANRGWIAEGYATAVLQDDTNFNNTNQEESLSMLWQYMNINSKPAAVEQDLVFGNIEFAIKSGNFSTPMVGQFINLATAITFMKKDFFDLNYFRKIASKVVNKRNLTEKTIAKAERQAIKEIEKELLTK